MTVFLLLPSWPIIRKKKHEVMMQLEYVVVFSGVSQTFQKVVNRFL